MEVHIMLKQDYHIEAAALSDVTMQESIDWLRERGLPICFEQVALIPERASRLADSRISYERTHFNVHFSGSALSRALDELCAADADYAWEQVGKRPTYVVYPARVSALSWPVPAQDFTGVDWITAIQRVISSGHQGIALFPRGLERQPKTVLEGLTPGESVARRWLAALVDYVNQGRFWTLGGVASARTLVIGQVAPAVDAR